MLFRSPIHYSTNPGHYCFDTEITTLGSKNKFTPYINNKKKFNKKTVYGGETKYKCTYEVLCEMPSIISNCEAYKSVCGAEAVGKNCEDERDREREKEEDLDPEGRETVSRSSAGMVFPHGLLVGIGPGLTTFIRTSSQSRGIYQTHTYVQL